MEALSLRDRIWVASSEYRTAVADVLGAVASSVSSGPGIARGSARGEGAGSASAVGRLLQSVAAQDAALGDVKAELVAQREREADLEEARNALAKRKAALAAFSSGIAAADRALTDAIDDADVLIRRAEGAKARGGVSLQGLLEYSQMLGYTTTAPPGFKAGEPLVPYLSPVPRDNFEMRDSRLFRLAETAAMPPPPGEKGSGARDAAQTAEAAAAAAMAAIRKFAGVSAEEVPDSVLKRFIPEDWRAGDPPPPLPAREKLVAEGRRVLLGNTGAGGEAPAAAVAGVKRPREPAPPQAAQSKPRAREETAAENSQSMSLTFDHDLSSSDEDIDSD